MLKSATSLLARSTVQRTARRIVTSSGRASSTSTSSSSAATEGFSRRLGTILVTASSSVVLALYLDSQRQTVQLDEASTPSKRPMRRSELISMDEVSQHNKEGDLWVVMNGDVWDLTEFFEAHPGGATPLLRAAGRDASNIFNPLHPPGTLESALSNGSLSSFALVGRVDPLTIKSVGRPEQGESIDVKKDKAEEKVDLAMIVGLPDFDAAAKAILPAKTWAYYSAGGTDEYSLALNRAVFNQVLFRPRVMRDVTDVDLSTEFLGHKVSMPVAVAPAGMASLSHPDGEVLLSSGAGKTGIAQFISTNASKPLAEILGGAVSPDQPYFMQLYVDRKRDKTEALMKKIEATGQIKGYFVTVDAAAPGKREADERSRAEVEVASGISGGKIQSDAKGGGIGRSVGGFIDPSLNWSDIQWLRSQTKLPIGLKGIQTVEDAKKAYDAGCDAIYLSNHGARALDGSPPALYTLLEINKFYPEIVKDKKCEIYLDGGIRRGTDAVKALCLGAKGVTIGRPLLYALAWGEEGVVHAIEIMRDEIETTLRLLGVNNISQLGPHLLNTRAVDGLIADRPQIGDDERTFYKSQ